MYMAKAHIAYIHQSESRLRQQRQVDTNNRLLHSQRMLPFPSPLLHGRVDHHSIALSELSLRNWQVEVDEERPLLAFSCWLILETRPASTGSCSSRQRARYSASEH